MGTSIKELAMDLGTVQVNVNGKALTLKRLSAKDQREARAHMPAPVAPRTKKDPTRGSAAELLPNHDDPEFQRAFLDYTYNVQAIELAIALDLELSDGRRWGPGIAASGAGAEAFARKAREELEQAWDGPTLARVHAALTEGATASQDALGNFSSPTSNPAT